MMGCRKRHGSVAFLPVVLPLGRVELRPSVGYNVVGEAVKAHDLAIDQFDRVHSGDSISAGDNVDHLGESTHYNEN